MLFEYLQLKFYKKTDNGRENSIKNIVFMLSIPINSRGEKG